MSGNVWEWCWDWLGDYSSEAQTDPDGSNLGFTYHICRGGSWYNTAESARSAYRKFDSPSNSERYIGFRIVRRDNSN